MRLSQWRLIPGDKEIPPAPFSKRGNKADGFKSPFEKGGFRGI